MAEGRTDKRDSGAGRAFGLQGGRECKSPKPNANKSDELQVREYGSQKNKAWPIIDRTGHGTPESDAAAEPFQTSQPGGSQQLGHLVQTTNPEPASGDMACVARSNGQNQNPGVPGMSGGGGEHGSSTKIPDRKECCDDCPRKLGNYGDEGCVHCSATMCPDCARNGICHIHRERQ